MLVWTVGIGLVMAVVFLAAIEMCLVKIVNLLQECEEGCDRNYDEAESNAQGA